MTKSLSKAIALATLVGAGASAQAAINVNPEGLGEVLLYSLYSVEKGNITNINITNTTNESKAVKVRFLEGQNSQEVLDFNLYLSPFDQWSGAITESGAGAQLISADGSCTLPAIPAAGVPFKDKDYKADGGNETIARTRLGHFEVIEMGVVTDSNLDLATRNKSCNALEAAFATGGVWKEKDGTANGPEFGMGKPTGGLYGSAEIMNIEESTVISYDATALQGFAATKSLHARPGTIYPNINGNIAAPATPGEKAANTSPSFTTNDAVINGAVVKFDSTVEAISAVLAKRDIHNNYVIDAGRESKTNWVISFPTKRFHVDAGMENGLLPLKAEKTYNRAFAPFTSLWANGKSCEAITVDAWDNDERVKSDLQFSPSEDGVNSLCYETNILTINKGQLLDNGELGLVHYNFDLKEADFPYGWMNIDFSQNLSRPYVTGAVTGADAKTGDSQVVGLPAIGFSAVKFKNGFAQPGVNNFYTSSTEHKATKEVITVK